MKELSAQEHQQSTERSLYLTTLYSELCNSYQTLREFRMKLLRLLPIASVIGLVVLGKALPSSPQPELQPEVVGYIGIFSAIFTLALFAYEVRSLLMCHDYSRTGANLEAAMGMHGQFVRCDETRHFDCYRGAIRHPMARIVNEKVTSSLVYSFVCAAWFFVGLKWTFELETHQCVRYALGIGALLAGVAWSFLTLLTREPKDRTIPENDSSVFIFVVES
jgi:hypothetical protein